MRDASCDAMRDASCAAMAASFASCCFFSKNSEDRRGFEGVMRGEEERKRASGEW